MAPEVAKEQPYNEAVDIYSVGIILWEMLANKTAFEGYSFEMHESMVIQAGVRPYMDPAWPSSVKDIIKRCWSDNYKERPSAHQLRAYLKGKKQTFTPVE